MIQVIQIYKPTRTTEVVEVQQLYEHISKAKDAVRTTPEILKGNLNSEILLRAVKKWDEKMCINYLQQKNFYCLNSFFKKSLQRKCSDGPTKNEIDCITDSLRKIGRKKEEYNTILEVKVYKIEILKEMEVNQLRQAITSSLEGATKGICTKKKKTLREHRQKGDRDEKDYSQTWRYYNLNYPEVEL